MECWLMASHFHDCLNGQCGRGPAVFRVCKLRL